MNFNRFVHAHEFDSEIILLFEKRVLFWSNRDNDYIVNMKKMEWIGRLVSASTNIFLKFCPINSAKFAENC